MTVEAIPTQEDYITALSEQEIPAYDHMRDDLEANHMGKWVVVRNAERVGIYDTFEEAAASAVKRFGRGPYLIRQVGAPPLTLPVFTFLSLRLLQAQCILA